RQGQMPAQEPYLGKEKVHILAAYIYPACARVASWCW
ncbi:hypothetical protein, partial [Pseudomonas aeruginosa]